MAAGDHCPRPAVLLTSELNDDQITPHATPIDGPGAGPTEGNHMPNKRAFVTGASRGIGKAIAIRLAQGGFDVAITARTVEEGEQREHSSTVKKSDTTPLPGSLTSTADAVRATGAEALVLPADLLDRGSLGAAAATVLERWGAVDLLVHN